MTSLSGYRGGGIHKTSKRTVSYERVDPSITKTMHWKFLSCREYGSGTGATANSMKDEKTPEIGPPMGETGSCISYNYLGSSKLDPLTKYVRCWDPHWCMRKITTSLGKALREHFKKTSLWNSSHSSVFCSFRKTLEALSGPQQQQTTNRSENDDCESDLSWDVCTTNLFHRVLSPILKDALDASESQDLVSLGLYNYVVLVRYALGASESGVSTDSASRVLGAAATDGRLQSFVREYAVATALVVRIHTATMYTVSTVSRIVIDSKMGLWLQLWMDEMLDLSYHTFLGNLLVKDRFPPKKSTFVDRDEERIKKEEPKTETDVEMLPVKDEPRSSEDEDGYMDFSNLFGSLDSDDDSPFCDPDVTIGESTLAKDWVAAFLVKKEEEKKEEEENGKEIKEERDDGSTPFIPDISEATQTNDERTEDSKCGVRCDDELHESGAMFMLRPHGRRFVTIGEIFDVSELMLRGNIWREIRPTTKDFLSHLIHILMSKPLLHKCLIRNIEDIIEFYCEQNPLLACLIKDLVHITMMGNYPTAKYRPGFLARMFLRRDNLVFFRADDKTCMEWFAENRKLVYYTLKEFHLYLVSLSPSIQEILVRTQWHTQHSAGIRKCMDQIRSAFGKSYDERYYAGIHKSSCKKILGGIDGSESVEIGDGLTLVENIEQDGRVLEEIRAIIKRVHNSQLKYITKLRKGSFARVLSNEMRSWYSREDKEAAMERFRKGELAELTLAPPESSPPGMDEEDEDIDEDSDQDLGKQILDPALQVVERVWKDAMPSPYPEDTSGHEFRTRIPLTEVIEYMYGSSEEEEGEGEEDQTEDEEEGALFMDEDPLWGVYEDDKDLQTIYEEELIRRLAEDEGVGDEDDAQREKIVKKSEESGIIGKMVLVDPDDFLSRDERNAIYLVAQFAKTRYDGVFEFWWLHPLGMSALGFYWLREMYYRYEITDVADNRLRTNLAYLFCARPRDFYILLGFLREFLSPGDPERIWLGENVALAQLEATRTKFSVLPWERSDVDLLGSRYYCVCGEWGDMVVGPFSEKRDSYSVGLSGVYCDALTGKVHCRKDKEECFDDEIRKVNMIGWAAKHGGRWYTLCATCGMLTHWNANQQSHRGPDCGKHRQNAEYAVAPEGQRAVIVDGIAITDQTKKKRPDPPGLDRLFMARKRAGTTSREITRQCLYCSTDGRGAQGAAVWVLRIPEGYDCLDPSHRYNAAMEGSALYSGTSRNGEELRWMNPTSTSRKHHNSCLRAYNEMGRFEIQGYDRQQSIGGESKKESIDIDVKNTETTAAEDLVALIEKEKEQSIEARNVQYARPQMTRVWLCNQDWKNARSKLAHYPVPLMQDLIAWIANARKQRIRRANTRPIIKQIIV